MLENKGFFDFDFRITPISSSEDLEYGNLHQLK